ncbi:GNAT family N-acetyltransferase [Azospirillum doebereinerae]
MADGGWGREAMPVHGSASRDRGSVVLPVTIRPARADDLPKLEWFGLHTPHREILGNAFRMQERGTGAMLLAELNDFPVGQVCVDFVRKRHLGRATLWALRVFLPFRGLGLGARLMRAAEAVVATNGGGVAELGVDRDNATVLPFYDQLGYVHCGTERGHFAYRTPDGVTIRVPIDQWLLHKRIAPALPARQSAHQQPAIVALAPSLAAE